MDEKTGACADDAEVVRPPLKWKASPSGDTTIGGDVRSVPLKPKQNESIFLTPFFIHKKYVNQLLDSTHHCNATG